MGLKPQTILKKRRLMKLMIKKMLASRWLPWTLAALLVCGLVYLKRHSDRPIKGIENKYLVETEVYRPPIIKLPFVKYKTPVPVGVLPIPKKEVDTSIVVTFPPGDISGGIVIEPVKIGIIIDKKGRVFKTKDTPDNVVIEITKWKEPFAAPEIQFGLALTYSQDAYAGLSVDLLRVWKLHLGSDLGISQDRKFMVGLHVRYKIIAVGYDFLNGRAYVGVVLVW